MKRCPNCNLTYEDSEFFCQQDGTSLVSFGSTEETVVIPTPSFNHQPYPNQVNVQSKNPIMYLTFGVILLLSALVVGLGVVFFYEKGKDEKTEKVENKPVEKTNEPKYSPQPVAKTPSNVPNPPVVPQPPTVNNEQIRNEVTGRISTWKSTAESRDLNSYMTNYAERIDYYRKNNAGKSFVLNDKQKAFSKFDSIKINIDIVSITPDAAGENASAIIDKEFFFQGASSISGKVRQEIRFRKIGGEWLITGEKDLKVFYLNK
jgi:hypothetical protein